MAKGSIRRIAFRRRREQKTNYHQRERLIKSGKVRLIIRNTLSHSIIQFASPGKNGDIIITAATTAELSKYGWKGSCKNIPANYLVGYLAGLKAKEAGLTLAMLDAGVKKPHYGSRVYAGVKGVIDTGMEVPLGDGVVPDEGRIKGEHIVKYWETLEDSDEKKHMFSQYLARGMNPKQISEHLEEVKQNIEKVFRR